LIYNFARRQEGVLQEGLEITHKNRSDQMDVFLKDLELLGIGVSWIFD